MSAWRAFRKEMTILERTERLLRAKAIKKPVWFDIMKVYPPDTPPAWAPRPEKVEFEEDRLLKHYFWKNKGEKAKTVFNLHDETQKPPAVLFVSRQLELMQKEGLSEEAAYDRVKAEFSGKSIGEASGDSQAADESVSLREKFDEWVRSEDQFWRQAAAARDSKTGKKKSN